MRDAFHGDPVAMPNMVMKINAASLARSTEFSKVPVPKRRIFRGSCGVAPSNRDARP